MTKRKVYVYELRIQTPGMCFGLQTQIVYIYTNEFVV